MQSFRTKKILIKVKNKKYIEISQHEMIGVCPSKRQIPYK